MTDLLVPFSVVAEPSAGTTTVRVTGDLDGATAGAVEAALLRAAAAAPEQHLVLDLRELTFFVSSGLRLVVQWDERRRGAFSVLGLDGPMGRVVGLVELEDLDCFALDAA